LKTTNKIILASSLSLAIYCISIICCTPATIVSEEEKLAKKYCDDACHLFPEPDLLDQKGWQGILPRMSVFFGLDQAEIEGVYGTEVEKKLVSSLNIYPQEPILPQKEWDQIKDYYLKNSPTELYNKAPAKLDYNLNFEAIPINTNGYNITYLGFDPGHQYIAAGLQQDTFAQLALFNSNGQKVDSLLTYGPVSDASFAGDEVFYSIIGKDLKATDLPLGSLYKVNLKNNRFAGNEELVSFLHRPVKILCDDFTGDGTEEVVIAEFGNILGKVSIHSWDKNVYKTDQLRRIAGAIDLKVVDLNLDGKKDIVTMFSQADERITVFYNKGNLEFEESTIMRFPPAYGSTNIEVIDFNEDGLMDLLYTNGDNLNSKSLKPYHGVRIYLNEGNNNFTLHKFIHINGAFKSMPKDIDQDGDIDIVLISYFPDYDHTADESFIYLENQGDLKFQSKSFKNHLLGRWISMDVNDLDTDGDLDILLGSNTTLKVNQKFLNAYSIDESWNKNPNGIYLLRNKLK